MPGVLDAAPRHSGTTAPRGTTRRLPQQLVPAARSLLATARRWPVATLVTVQVWCAFAAYALFIVVTGPVGYWQDSASYVALARAPFPSVHLLAGPRPPLVPLVWKLTGTTTSLVVVQALAGIAAWTLLAIAVARLVPPGSRRALAASAVLALASCWQVTEWNWNLLSESLAVSATAAAIAFCLLLADRFTRSRAAGLVAVCLVLVADRDPSAWTVGIGGIALVAWSTGRVALRRLRSSRTKGSDTAGSTAGRARELALLGLVLVAVAGAGQAALAVSGRGVSNVEDVFAVRVFPFAGRVAWFAAHGMPQAKQIDVIAAASSPSPGQAEVVAPDLAARQFRPLERWFATDAEASYVEFLVTHPWLIFSEPFVRPELTYNNAQGNLAFYGGLIAPAATPAAPGQSASSGPPPSNHALPLLPDLFWPSWQLVVALALVAAVLALLRGVLATCEAALLAAVIGVGLVAMLLSWHGDGMEVARHTLEGAVEARIGVLVLAILAVLRRRAPSRRAESPVPPLSRISARLKGLSQHTG